MSKNKIIFIISLMFLVTSCGSWDSIKRGLTGQKQNSIDEFLVEKKDPLILPPDFENLPTPSDRQAAVEEMSSFEKTMQGTTLSESTTSTTSSSEKSILQQIKKK